MQQCSDFPPCYCQETGVDEYLVTFEDVAFPDHSHADVKFVWRNKSTTFTTSDIKTLPRVYVPGSEMLLAMVNNIPLSGTSASCSIILTKDINAIDICCFNAPHPCHTTISVPGFNMSDSPCLEWLVAGTDEGVLTFSHSVCGDSPIEDFTCTVVSNYTPPETSYGTTTTLMSNVTNDPFYSSKCWCPLDCLPCPWCCILLKGIIVVVCATLFVIYLVCCRQTVREEKSSNEIAEGSITFRSDADLKPVAVQSSFSDGIQETSV